MYGATLSLVVSMPLRCNVVASTLTVAIPFSVETLIGGLTGRSRSASPSRSSRPSIKPNTAAPAPPMIIAATSAPRRNRLNPHPCSAAGVLISKVRTRRAWACPQPRKPLARGCFLARTTLQSAPWLSSRGSIQFYFGTTTRKRAAMILLIVIGLAPPSLRRSLSFRRAIVHTAAFAHVAQRFDFFPPMGWRLPQSTEYVDLVRAVAGLILLPAGYLRLPGFCETNDLGRTNRP